MKTTVEQDLLEIKQCKIDMLILQRANDKLCETNNNEIARLSKVVEGRETSAAEKLLESGVKKIETSAGYVSFREMPDKWVYDIPKLISWAKKEEERQERYVKVIEEFKKAQLKKDYAEGIIVHDDVCDEGLTVTTQNPKFTYKLKGGLL